MSNYKNFVVDKKDTKPEIPKSVRKLIGPKASITKRVQKALNDNPGSYCISWSEVFACTWSIIKVKYKTNGIFPPSVIVDHKNTPETENFTTEAMVNASWLNWSDANGNVKQIIPKYIELRIYHRNVMQCVYEKFKHYVPETAMIAYMTNIGFHEYHHYLDYYDKSFDVDVKLGDDYTIEDYYASTGDMYNFINNKDEVADERETERAAILDTLQYMAYAFAGENNGKNGLQLIPGGPYDLLLREKNDHRYRMASYMCEYLWMQWHIDFDDDDDLREYERRQKKILLEFKRRYEKDPKKMIIVD